MLREKKDENEWKFDYNSENIQQKMNVRVIAVMLNYNFFDFKEKFKEFIQKILMQKPESLT